MNSLLMQVDQLNNYIREFQKIDSKMEAGQFFAARRSLKRIEAEFIRMKEAIIEMDKRTNVEEGVKHE